MPWGSPWGSPWGVTVEIVQVVPRGSHSFWVRGSISFGSIAEEPARWSITRSVGGSKVEATHVALAALDDGDASGITIYTDQALQEGIEYDVSTSATWTSGLPIDPFTITGIRDTGRKANDPEAALVDLHAPFGQSYELDASGVHRMSAGLETLRKVVLDRLLTVMGSLPWAPEYGSDLPHKGVRPANLRPEARKIERLIKRVPLVKSVSVELLWEEGELVAILGVATKLGDLNERVEVPR